MLIDCFEHHAEFSLEEKQLFSQKIKLEDWFADDNFVSAAHRPKRGEAGFRPEPVNSFLYLRKESKSAKVLDDVLKYQMEQHTVVVFNGFLHYDDGESFKKYVFNSGYIEYTDFHVCFNDYYSFTFKWESVNIVHST